MPEKKQEMEVCARLCYYLEELREDKHRKGQRQLKKEPPPLTLLMYKICLKIPREI